MGTAFVEGLQGSSLSDGVIATAKHFVGYGAGEGGLNWAPAHIGDRELREVYLHPFEAAVVHSGIRSMMNAYHELDGVPCCASGELLSDILREAWGFDGIVVSDYFAVDQLATYHRLAAGKVEAAAMALEAGLDTELPSTDCFAGPLATALAEGLITQATLDRAVRRTLRLKFELGLFENPYVDADRAVAAVDTPDHRSLAREVAQQSMVLLRNQGALPLGDTPGVIAVIGPNADTVRNLRGDYAYPAHIESLIEMREKSNVFAVPIPDDVDFVASQLEGTTILDALRTRFGDAVRYAPGCAVNDDDTSGFAEAVELAAAADVAVLVLGDKSGLTTDCTSGEGRDRSTLDLPGVQEQLARAVLDTGTPVVTVLVVGRPCGSEEIHRRSDAVLLAWLPGQEGGAAVADVLAGEVNPGGKLPITFPRSVGQVPVFYAHKVSGGRSHWHGDYVDGPATPMYPFGYGLGYTAFEVTDAEVETPTVADGESVRVSVSVTNTGAVTGDEVVQLYVRDTEASITRPLLELKSFARVTLEPGSTRRVTFEVAFGQLGFYDRALEYVTEEGEIEIFVGTSSADVISAGTTLVKSGGPTVKSFDGARHID
jgi:beta-glucosidase